MTEKKIFIGVAWPYANGRLHLGHIAGCLLPADIFSRFQRMQNNSVLMVSGSDEHGTPITITAHNEGISPQEVVDRYHKSHVDDLRDMGIVFDIFTRTTTENHRVVVQDMFKTLYEKGHLYRKEVTAYFCETCNKYLPDRYIEGICPHCGYEGARGDQCDGCGKLLDPTDLKDARCKICKTQPILKDTEHVFFTLSRFEEPLLAWIESKKASWRSNVQKFTYNWLKNGLLDRAVTRDIAWGIPIPLDGFETKRMYVWFDAVTGYLSASKEWSEKREDPAEWEDWWLNDESRHYYFLAKDNIPFHSIIWPSMLMAYDKNMQLPYDIPANEYLCMCGDQFSKSRGIGIWTRDALDNFDADAIRYYLTINMPETRDANWTWEDFVAKNNDELVGTYGNFIHRVLMFTKKNYGSIPDCGDLTAEDEVCLAKIDEVSSLVAEHLERCEFKKALRTVMTLAQTGNVYFDSCRPWKLVKEERDRCATVLHVCLRLTQALGVMMSPFLPFSSERICRMLGHKAQLCSWDNVKRPVMVGVVLESPRPLFKKLNIDDIVTVDEKEEQEGDPFSRVDLRVASILKVDDHPKADKLYVLTLDLGEMGSREVVAGMKPYYEKETLLGKHIVVVANLKPAKLRGILSNGMLLAAEDDKGTVALLDAGRMSIPGTPVMAEGVKSTPAKVIEFSDFKEIKLTVDGKQTIRYGEKRLLIGGDIALKVDADRKVDEGAGVL